MVPFWLILGTALILSAIFNRPLLRWLGSRPLSEVLTHPARKHSSKIIEQIVRWLLVILGIGFILQGLNGMLPGNLSDKIAFSLIGLAALLFLSIMGITVMNWKAK